MSHWATRDTVIGIPQWVLTKDGDTKANDGKGYVQVREWDKESRLSAAVLRYYLNGPWRIWRFEWKRAVRASNRKYRGIGSKLRCEIIHRDNYTCKYCGEIPPSVKLEVDHIVPLSRGETNDRGNLVTACRRCNQGKGARLVY